MKKSMLILLSLALAGTAFPQKNAKDSVSLMIGNGRLFSGHKNDLYLEGPGAYGSKLTIITNRGTLEKKDDYSYSLTLPDDCPPGISLAVIRDSSGVKKLVYTSIQNISKAPAFMLFPLLAGAYGTIKKETILQNPVITLISFNDDVTLDWELFTVKGFTLSLNSNGDLVSVTEKSNKFNARMIDLINKTVKGQRIIIEDIRAVGDKGTMKQIPSFIVVID